MSEEQESKLLKEIEDEDECYTLNNFFMNNNIQISAPVMDVLERSHVEGSLLYLPAGQLDRKLYEAVNKILTVLGGAWKKGKKAHEFAYDPRDAIESAMLTGSIVDLKKKFQAFDSPPAVADQVAELAGLSNGDDVLEPSAGTGALVAAALRTGVTPEFTLLDLDPAKVKGLRAKFPTAAVLEGDFLTYLCRHDRIIQNPPFTRQQDVAHVLHAYSLLKPSGVLVSVVSESPFSRQTPQAKQFRELLHDTNAQEVDLERGDFSVSGTEVKTRIVRICK